MDRDGPSSRICQRDSLRFAGVRHGARLFSAQSRDVIDRLLAVILIKAQSRFRNRGSDFKPASSHAMIFICRRSTART